MSEYKVEIQFLAKLVPDRESIEKFIALFRKITQNLGLNIDIDENEFRKIEKEIENIMNEIEREFQEFATKIEKGFEGINLDKLEEDLQEVDKTMDELSDKEIDEMSVDEFLTGVDDINKKTKEMIKNTDLIDKELKDIEKEGATAFDKVGQEIKQTTTEMKGLTGGLEAFTNRILAVNNLLSVVNQISSAFSQFIDPYKEFDKQLRNIGTLGVKNFEEFRDKAIELASGVPDTVAQVTQGIYNAISAGAIKVVDGIADVEGGLKFVEVASKLAVAGLTDTNSAIKGLAANLNAYGESTAQAERYADILFNTVNNGVTTIEELNQYLSQVVPTAASLGIRFEEVAAAIATMTQQGTPTAQATTKIRAALSELATPGAKLKPILDSVGISLKSMKEEGLVETMRKLKVALEQAGVSAVEVFSSIEAAGAVMQLSGEKVEKFASIYSTYLVDAVGSTQRAFDIASAGIGIQVQGVLNMIEAQFFKLFHSLGDGFVSLLDLTTKLAPMMMTFGSLATIIPPGTIRNVQQFAYNVGSKLVPSLFQAIDGQMKLNLAMLKSPYMLVAAGITALGVAVGLYLTKTEEGRKVLDKIETKISELWRALEPLFDELVKLLGNLIEYLIKVGEYFVTIFGGAISVVVELVSSLIEFFTELFGVSDNLGKSAKGLAGAIEYLNKGFEIATTGVQYLIEGIKILFSIITGFIQVAPDALKLFFESATYYLNPVNWFSSDEAKERELEQRFTDLVGRLTGRVKSQILESGLEIKMDEIIKIREGEKENEQIRAMIEQFRRAKTEVERIEIGRKIAEQVPSAVEGYRMVVNEAGELTKVFDINIEKATAFYEKQKRIFEADIKTKQDEYSANLREMAEQYSKISIEVEKYEERIARGEKLSVEEMKAFKEKSEQMNVLRENIVSFVKEAEDVGIKIDIGIMEGADARLVQDVLNSIDAVKTEVDKIDITKVVKIKTEVEMAEDLTGLIEEYEKAGDLLVKQKIAERIKEVAPEIVKVVGATKTAEGEIVSIYEIQKSKMDEVIEKRKKLYGNEQQNLIRDIAGAVKTEVDNIQELSNKADELYEVIKRKKAEGLDTKKEEDAYRNIILLIQKQKNGIIDLIINLEKQGIATEGVYRVIADALGVSVEQLREMVAKQRESKSEAKKQEEGVKSLGQQWEEAKKKAKEYVESNIFELASLKKQIAETNDEAKKKELQKKYDELLSKTRATNENLKIMDKLETEVKSEVEGTVEKRKGVAKATESEIDLLEKRFNLIKQNIQTEYAVYELALMERRIRDENFKKEEAEMLLKARRVEDLEKEYSNYLEMLEKMKLIKIEGGEIKYTTKFEKLKSEEKEKVKSELVSIQKEIANSKLDLIEMKARLKLDEEDVRKQIQAIEFEDLQFKVKLGLESEDKLIEYWNNEFKQYENLGREIERIKGERDKLLEEMQTLVERAETEKEREYLEIYYKNLLNEYDKKIVEIKRRRIQVYRETIGGITGLIKTESDELVRILEERNKEIEIRSREEMEVFQRGMSKYIEFANILIERRKENEIKLLQESSEEQIRSLEDYKNKGLITESEFQRRKNEIVRAGEEERSKIEEEARKKRLVLQELAHGQELARLRQQEIEKLQAQKEILKKQLELYEALPKDEEGNIIFESEEQKKQYEKLKETLEAVEVALKEKGDVIKTLVENLGMGIQEGIASMFSGDWEKMKDDMRKSLSIIAGYLQKEIDAFILKLVLSEGVKKYLATLPWPLNVLSIPIIMGVVSGTVRAITTPILTSILSFSEGGRVNEPTLALVGDASKLGGRNIEWIMRDEQLQETINIAINRSDRQLLNELKALKNEFKNIRLETRIGVDEIVVLLTNRAISERIRMR